MTLPTLIVRSGSLVTVGGALATSTDCCCPVPPQLCGGCEEETPPATLSIVIDATGAIGNPLIDPCDHEIVPEGCPCDDCEAMSGEYDVDFNTELSGFGDDRSPYVGADVCIWTGTYPGPGFNIPCDGPGYNDRGLYDTNARFQIGLDSGDGHYYAYLEMDWATPSPGPYQWKKDLGTTLPNCTELFPITFTADDYIPHYLFDDLADICDFRDPDITATVDIA